MATSLAEILVLVGSLDDAAGTDTARERFRTYLKAKISSVGFIPIERTGVVTRAHIKIP